MCNIFTTPKVAQQVSIHIFENLGCVWTDRDLCGSWKDRAVNLIMVEMGGHASEQDIMY